MSVKTKEIYNLKIEINLSKQPRESNHKYRQYRTQLKNGLLQLRVSNMLLRYLIHDIRLSFPESQIVDEIIYDNTVRR